MSDKLLDYGLDVLRASQAKRLTHDPVTAIKALRRVLEVACLLEKEYRAADENEVRHLPKKTQASRKQHIQEARERATRAAAETYHEVMMKTWAERRSADSTLRSETD